MKNLGPIIVGIIIGAIVTYFTICQNQLGDQSGEPPKPPEGVISIQKATELSNNWTAYRKPAVDSCAQVAGQKTDDRCVSWNLKDLRAYLSYAESESKKLGYEMTGIRVNLGVYGAHEVPECRSLTTMFIAPTGHKTVSKASSLNLSTTLQHGDLPVRPYNKGTGGGHGYP